MTTIAILPESARNGAGPHRAGVGWAAWAAWANGYHSSGQTVGEALDALNAQLPSQPETTLVVVQHFRPDLHFTDEQTQRLQALMDQWRTARATGKTLPAQEQAELDNLVEAEVRAAGERAAAMLRGLQQ